MYASSIAYFDARCAERGPLWWPLDAAYAWLWKRGLTYSAKDWFKRFRRIVALDGPAGTYSFRTSRSLPSEITPLCTTRCLTTSLWHTVMLTKWRTLERACLQCLQHAGQRACLDLPEELRVVTVRFPDRTLVMRVAQHGDVVGFLEVLLRIAHRASVNSLGTS